MNDIVWPRICIHTKQAQGSYHGVLPSSLHRRKPSETLINRQTASRLRVEECSAVSAPQEPSQTRGHNKHEVSQQL